MNKRRIYIIQPAYLNGKSAYIPYAAGALLAYVFEDDEIKENYEPGEIIFMRENIDDVVSRLDCPYYVGFSTYMWNFEYNKRLAEKIKQKFPSCYVQFGGHQIVPGSSLLEECGYIDFLIHNEGEEPLRLLLKELLCEEPDLKNVPNLSYRADNRMINNVCVTPPDDLYYPSPYLGGWFDGIIEAHPDFQFLPLMETNRGCPNHCAYCGWGMYKSKIRFFPMERVKKELEWISNHKFEFFGFADANFGMFERDSEIVDMIVDLKKRTGFPAKFQVSYAKNSTVRIFEMTKKLNGAGMDKGVTLAFQSLSPEVLDNIGRSNIALDFYSDLLKMYNAAEIPTYSDLILGLPGETYESFVSGIDTLLNAGQHSSLFIHILEWLPCSLMGSKEYMEKYGIEYTLVPLNQPHRIKTFEDDIPEYSRIITKNYTMGHDDWIKMNMFSSCVQCFHHLGLLEYIAIYCHYSLSVSYGVFYNSLLEWLDNNPSGSAGEVFSRLKRQFTDVVEKNGSVVCFDEEKYGPVSWTSEEYAFLEIVSKKEEFYEEIRPFVNSLGIDAEVLNELIVYQNQLVKCINNPFDEKVYSYDFPSYFAAAFAGESIPLKKRKNIVTVTDKESYSSYSDYARFVVWYGRRGGKNIYLDETTVAYPD